MKTNRCYTRITIDENRKRRTGHGNEANIRGTIGSDKYFILACLSWSLPSTNKLPCIQAEHARLTVFTPPHKVRYRDGSIVVQAGIIAGSERLQQQQSQMFGMCFCFRLIHSSTRIEKFTVAAKVFTAFV